MLLRGVVGENGKSLIFFNSFLVKCQVANYTVFLSDIIKSKMLGEDMQDHKYTKMQLIDILDKVVNKTFGEVDTAHVFDKTIDNPKITGIAGDVVENSILGYPSDSYQAPDLNVDGNDVELKTTGIRKVSGQFVAKEPMSITAVSPEKITDEKFNTSNFWHKLEKMLIVYYHYNSKKQIGRASCRERV